MVLTLQHGLQVLKATFPEHQEVVPGGTMCWGVYVCARVRVYVCLCNAGKGKRKVRWHLICILSKTDARLH